MRKSNIERKANRIKTHISIHAVPGVNAGEIELLWQPLENSLNYVVQFNQYTGTKQKWKHADIVSRTRYTATGLRSGRNYSFRVAPVTPNGQQDWSLPVIEKAS